MTPRISFTRQIAIGVLLAALLMPVTVQAQWAVFDVQNLGAQLKAQAQALSRWIETVNQYTRMYENAVGQLTNLKGILRTADDLLAHDKRMRTLISNWGQVIRLSFRIKNQLTNLVAGNIRAIANIEQRLRNGIFDPEADRRDFEEYLRYGIGRTAQDTESELERLKRMDNQFERLEYDNQIAADKAAQLGTYLEDKKEELERLKNCDDCTEKDRDIEHLSFEIAKLEEKLAQSQAEANRLFDLKAKRAEAIYQVEMQRMHFGRTIGSMNRAWKSITTATQELRDKLEQAKDDN
jgi:ABC-type transporter Mla subunit MlaD